MLNLDLYSRSSASVDDGQKERDLELAVESTSRLKLHVSKNPISTHLGNSRPLLCQQSTKGSFYFREKMQQGLESRIDI